MMNIYKLALLLIFCFSSVLSFSQREYKTDFSEVSILSDFERGYYSQDFGFQVPEQCNKTLYDTIETWLGTPYCYAGNSKNGVDCSGFVNELYHKVYHLNIGARNSGDIYKKITKVDKEDLIEGDLVFFRIKKRRITHVGLYLGNGKFVHAGASSGVTISDMSDAYYKRYYAGGGRLAATMESNVTQ